MTVYKLNNVYQNERPTVNKILGTIVVSIPFDPANTDYQEYLKWVAEGNEPLPPDSQE